MSTHIEAPWLVTVLGDSFRVQPHTHSDVICDDENGESCQWSEYNIATARLIAAAPDLLHACRSMLSCCYYMERNDETLAAVKSTMKAIAKATGDAP